MAGPIIIVVDDNQFFIDTIEAILQNTYELHSFLSGGDALKYMESNPADLVLLDYEMPGLTGYETMMKMRAASGAEKLPIIFITAETSERMKLEMIDRGATDYICKPIDSAHLKQCLSKYLNK